MEQIRIHGRGGQGVVTAAELIALAAFYDGHEAQAFPNFGVERSGAPIQSYARISEQAIITREQVYQPTILIIQDNTLLNSQMDLLLKGVQQNTKIIINASKNIWPELEQLTKYIYCTPATEVALKILGKNIVNTVILGALIKYTGVITLDSLKKAIHTKFAGKKADLISKNIKAVSLIGKI